MTDEFGLDGHPFRARLHRHRFLGRLRKVRNDFEAADVPSSARAHLEMAIFEVELALRVNRSRRRSSRR